MLSGNKALQIEFLKDVTEMGFSALPKTIRLRVEKVDQFTKDSIEKKKKKLEAVEEEFKKNKRRNIKILEKHFHDRTLQPLS
ncbi:hypothetical protein [Wolbachia endosymbiont of Mansonella perstans]|uniref:hypothetical protein n=1 Tax=Wolbachia endosymbiont of Mansonella perstans TaxID=229526 RepID=UPI001CE06C43|nr:hypothetical protein [Wolbachia endosymbiont of Mansonella perstans]MCA4774355.1 hypothetical protein [Wolbachia endosymbiont of Mansonella perstans]